MARTYDLDTWEKGTLVSPAQADLTTGIVTPAKYSGNTPVTPERLEYMSDSIRYLFTEGAASKDIFIGPEEEAPEDAKIIIDSNQMATPTNIEQMIDDKLSSLRGKILWTNSSSTSEFSGQSITIDEFLDYDAYEVIYLYSIGSPYTLSSGKLPTSQRGTVLYMLYNSTGNNFYTSRIIDINENTISFYDAYDNADTKVNNRCVPMYIICYKTGLFSEEV